MDDQKVLKKRLKMLMNRPENQVCADCPERQPRWASLIVLPPGAQAGQLSTPIGAFVCLECSGSHRRLGVHIAFVRSINLDSWKEKEVVAMENGGNTLVNCVFEGALTNPSIKPHNHADGPTRERFIRDKYERRKYYNPNGFSAVTTAAASASASVPPKGGGGGNNSYDNGPSVGPPSDVARQRLEERRQRINNNSYNSYKNNNGNSNGFERSSSSITPSRKNSSGRNNTNTPIAKAPASASVDLLDFGSSTNNIDSIALPSSSQTDDFFGASSTVVAATNTSVPAKNNFNTNAFEANFSSAPTTAPTPVSTPAATNNGGGIDMFAFLTQDIKKDETQQPQQQQTTSSNKSSFGGDIMSLYAPKVNQPLQSFMNPNNGMGNLSNSMAGMNFGTTNMNGMTGMQGGVGVSGQNQQQLQQQQMMMMMQQQQQMQQMQQQKNQMMFNGSSNNNNMMMMQQQQLQQQQGGMMMNQATGAGNGAMGGFPMGQVGMGGGNAMMMQQQQQQQQQQFGFNNGGGMNNSSSDNGFGTPMGMGPSISTFSQNTNNNNVSSPTKHHQQQLQPQVPEKEDPFAQFGMNVFRT